MSRLGSERYAVQNPILRYAAEAGWTYLPPEEALRLRRGETGLVLHEVLVDRLQRLNPGVVDHLRAEEIIRRLEIVPPTIEGNQEIWEYLKGLKTVFVETERRERNVRLLDPANTVANTFHVTDEFSYTNGTHTIRADVVFMINGVPMIIVETKSAKHLEGIAEALDQVRRYHHEGPELMAILQLFTLTHLLRFFYSATWSLSRKALFNWRDEVRAGFKPAPNFETQVKAFVAPSRVLRVISDFILFTRKDEELQKVVLRPHQMRAVERVVRRARDPEKRRALVWHTQGSGKTYTMITVAKKLIEEPQFGNPTVLMIVDRNELEAQLFGNLGAVGFGTVEVARTKRHLLELLRADRRGLIVSMIHKFDDVPANVLTRENVFVLVDEAHRTTGGALGNYLMGALPNATYVGFTGTPIDKTAHGKGTFKVFGADDEQGYLDKYSIRESIEDGTTVPLHYALAPNELLVDRETLEREFLNVAELEGVSEIEELNRALERAVTLKNMLKNRKRVSRVAEFIARHFRETIEPTGYKAFLVATDREACILYKKELDRHLPPEYSAVVMSAAHNDPPELAEFHLSEDEEGRIRKAFRKPDELPEILIVTEKLLTGFDAPILYKKELDRHLPPEYSAVVMSAAHNDPPELAEFHLSEEEEGRIRKAFRKPDELPKILIVTEKLLTGFDAPILYCMYLDKPMRDHVLLQAIARVNRPYEDEEGRRKPAGFVLDFVGIFDKLESALAFDSEEVRSVVQGIDVLQERFERLVAEGREAYLPLRAGLQDDKATEAVLEHFRDREPREEFYRYFREVEELYEILSPAPFLRPFLKDYEELTDMYRVVRANYAPHVPVDRSFMRKTALLVQEHTATYSVGAPDEDFRLTAETLERLANEETPETVKVFNLIKAFHNLTANGEEAPYLIPIGEQAEQIAEAFKERQATTQETLEQLTELVGEQKEAEIAWREMNLSPDGFAVFWSLKREGVKGAEEAARRFAATLEEHPHWRRSEKGEREVRRALYKALLGAGAERITELAEHLMDTLRKASP